MDARSFTGDDERALSVPACEACGCQLYPEEVAAGECRRCVEERVEVEADQRAVA